MTTRRSTNPILPGQGVTDPHMRVIGDRVWLFASHDADKQSFDFDMRNWQIWSTSDMINWKLETTIKPTETYIGPSHECWAPDAIDRNGKVYFYFSHCVHSTGVMVADQPEGPYKDALGEPLLPKGLTPTLSYDPGIFIDVDEAQSPYIVFGSLPPHGAGYYIAKLAEDMISLAEEPRKVELDVIADDKPALHYHNGRYYLTWQSFYAVSDNVYGPYQYVGNTNAAFEHGCYFEWNNQWFHAYGVQDPTATYRNTALNYVHFKDNGEMVEDGLPNEYGVGHYDGRWNRINTSWYMASQNVDKIESPRGGFEIYAKSDGAWVSYPHVHDLEDVKRMSLFACTTNPEGCTIEIHEGHADGPLLGSAKLGPTNNDGPGDWKGYFPAIIDLSLSKPEHDIVLVFRGKGADLCRVEWMRFLP